MSSTEEGDLDLRHLQRESVIDLLVGRRSDVKKGGRRERSELPSDQILGKVSFHHNVKDLKILIYDDFGEKMFKSLFQFFELRSFGVTMVLKLNPKQNENEPPEEQQRVIEDGKAYYFVKGTQENVDFLIHEICVEQKYYEYYLFFLPHLKRKKMEYFVRNLIKENKSKIDLKKKIRFLGDFYMNYVPVEKNFVSLNVPTSLHEYFKFREVPPELEQKKKNYVDEITTSLFNICVSQYLRLGVDFPMIFIREKSLGSVSFQIGQLLSQRIRHFLNSQKEKKEKNIHESRNVLILFEREIDFLIFLKQSWNYKSLLHNHFKFQNGQVYLPNEQEEEEEGEEEIKKKNEIMIDLKNDKMFEMNKYLDYDVVVKKVNQKLVKYRKNNKRFKDETGMDPENPDLEVMDLDISNHSKKKKLVQSVFLLQNEKQVIMNHLKIQKRLMKIIKTNKLDQFFIIENKLIKFYFYSKQKVLSSVRRRREEDGDYVDFQFVTKICESLSHKSILNSEDVRIIKSVLGMKRMKEKKKLEICMTFFLLCYVIFHKFSMFLCSQVDDSDINLLKKKMDDFLNTKLFFPFNEKMLGNLKRIIFLSKRNEQNFKILNFFNGIMNIKESRDDEEDETEEESEESEENQIFNIFSKVEETKDFFSFFVHKIKSNILGDEDGGIFSEDGNEFPFLLSQFVQQVLKNSENFADERGGGTVLQKEMEIYCFNPYKETEREVLFGNVGRNRFKFVNVMVLGASNFKEYKNLMEDRSLKNFQINVLTSQILNVEGFLSQLK